jgi:hypothetical protein
MKSSHGFATLAWIAALAVGTSPGPCLAGTNAPGDVAPVVPAAESAAEQPESPAVADAAGAIVIACRVFELPIAEFEALRSAKGMSPGGLVTDALRRRILQSASVNLLWAPQLVTMPRQSAEISVTREMPAATSATTVAESPVGMKLTAMAQPDEADPSCLDTTVDIVFSDGPGQDSGSGSSAFAPTPRGALTVRSERRITSRLRVPNGGTVLFGGVPGGAGRNGSRQHVLAVLLTASQTLAATAIRCRSLILGDLNYEGASVAEIVAHLAQSARAADPQKKGVNIVLDFKGPGEPPLVTLKLRGVPLYDALNLVTRIAGLRLSFEEHAVVISAP